MINNTKLNSLNSIPCKCPHCQSEKYIKYGYYNNIQRFRCSDCGRTFSIRTNSPWYYSKKSNSLWESFWYLQVAKTSLAKCAETLKINIATAFHWRHKILNTLQTLTEPQNLFNTVSITKRIIRENCKGSSKIFLSKTDKIWYAIAADNNDNILTTPFCLNYWDKKAFNNLIYNKIDLNSSIIPFGDAYIYNATKSNSPYPTHDYIDEDGDWYDYMPKNAEEIKNIVRKTLFSFNDVIDKARGISTKYIKHYLALSKIFTMKKEFSSSSVLHRSYDSSVYIKCCEIKCKTIFN